MRCTQVDIVVWYARMPPPKGRRTPQVQVLLPEFYGTYTSSFNGMPLCGPAAGTRSRRHIGEKWTESFRHGRMRENGITQVRIGQTRQHRHLYHGHDLAGFTAYHRETKNVVVARGDKRLHKALRFADRVRAKHRTHRQFRDSHFDTLTLHLAFAQSHPCELGIRKHAVGNQPVSGRAVCPGHIVTNDPEVVKG